MTRTYNHLYPQIYDLENLWLAWRRARRGGKRKWRSVADFEFDLEHNLYALHEELRDRTYAPGPYRNLTIREPKVRRISAAPFCDRVVHHALMQVTWPIFEARMIVKRGSSSGLMCATFHEVTRCQRIETLSFSNAAIARPKRADRVHLLGLDTLDCVTSCDTSQLMPLLDQRSTLGFTRRSSALSYCLCDEYNVYYDADAIREEHVTFSERSRMKGGRRHFGNAGGTPESGKNTGNSNLHAARWDQAFHPKGRNKRTVWEIPLGKFRDVHLAVYPEKLVETCLLASTREGDFVLDPFAGSGTTGAVACKLLRRFTGVELAAKYQSMAQKRIDEANAQLRLFGPHSQLLLAEEEQNVEHPGSSSAEQVD